MHQTTLPEITTRTGRDLAVPLLMLASVVAWGAGFSGGRLLLEELGATTLTFARTALTALTFTLLLPLVRPAPPIRQRGDHWHLAAAGIIGVAVYNLALFWGLTRVEAGVSSIVIATAPLMIALLARIWLNEPLDAGRAAGLVIAFGGVVVLAVLSGDGLAVDRTIGLVILAGAPLAWAVYTVLTKSLGHRYDPVDLTHRGSWYATLALVPLAARDLEALTQLSLVGWLWLIYLGVIGGGVTVVIYAWSLKRWPAAQLSSFVLLVPISGIAWGWALLGERPGPGMIIGGAFVFVGLLLVWRSRPISLPRSFGLTRRRFSSWQQAVLARRRSPVEDSEHVDELAA